MNVSVNEIYDFYELKNSSWGGADYNLSLIERFCNKYKLDYSIFYDYINDTIENCFNGSIDRTKLNDLFWFDDDYVAEFFNNNNPDNINKDYEYWFEVLDDTF